MFFGEQAALAKPGEGALDATLRQWVPSIVTAFCQMLRFFQRRQRS